MMQLAPHFTLGEMTRTQTGLLNVPSGEEICRLRALCSAVLEPWRERAGPLRVTSGFRAPEVNRAIGGSATSQHMLGEAADVVPVKCELADAWLALVQLVAHGLPVDQAIVYQRPAGGGWLHVSHSARHTARRELLVQPAQRPGVYIPWERWRGALVV